MSSRVIVSRFATHLTLVGVFLTGNVLCAFAPNYGVLVVARILIALVSGTLVAIAMTYVPDVTAERYRTKFIAWVFSGFSIASVVGVPVGTWVANTFGWRCERAYDGTYCAHGDGAAAQQPYCEDWFSAAIPPVFSIVVFSRSVERVLRSHERRRCDDRMVECDAHAMCDIRWSDGIKHACRYDDT